jgi:hypothetical protein
MAAAAQKEPPNTRPVTGVDATAGRAHGIAGETDLLLTLYQAIGDEATLAAAVSHVTELASRTRRVLPAARSAGAVPIAVSWCQGLAGVGPVLLRASIVLGDAQLGDLAVQAAEVCIAKVPGLAVLGRCCGAAGVGQFMIDLAVTWQDDRYLRAAFDIGRHMLLRSSGPAGHPVLAQDIADRSAAAWAFGIAGLLPFFRRLAAGGELASLPLPG